MRFALICMVIISQSWMCSNVEDSKNDNYVAASEDLKYANYVAAIQNFSTFSYFMVVRVKDLNSGNEQEVCTKGNFLSGAIHREYSLGYDHDGSAESERIALDNTDRYFEFKNPDALKNIGFGDYSMKDLKKLEKKVDFDSLAEQIRMNGKWGYATFDDEEMSLYAHAQFNRGILTGENSCFGGMLEYVDLKE